MRLLSVISMMFALPALLGITACGTDVVAPPETTVTGTAPSVSTPLEAPSTRRVEAPAAAPVEHTTIIVQAPTPPAHEVIIEAPQPPPHQVTVVIPSPPSITLTPPSPGSVQIH